MDAAEIDPIYYQKSYYLAPSDDSAKKAYTLLVKAMDDAQRIGVATFVMRGKQYLCAIRPSGNVLVLETMYFADEVRDPATGARPAADAEQGRRQGPQDGSEPGQGDDDAVGPEELPRHLHRGSRS